MIKLGLGGNHTMGLGLSLNRKFQTGVGGGLSNTVDLFICCGQSNAQGLGNSAQSPASPNNLYITGTTISTLADPVGNANTGSAWPAFANEWNVQTGNRAAIVARGVNGSFLLNSGANWSPSGTLRAAAVTACNDAITAINASSYTLGNVYFVWLQGESEATTLNGTTITAALYEQALEDLADYFKAQVPSMQGLYVINISGRGGSSSLVTKVDAVHLGFEEIRAAQVRAVADNANLFTAYDGTYHFLARGLLPDGLHYSQTGYNLTGLMAARGVANGQEVLLDEDCFISSANYADPSTTFGTSRTASHTTASGTTFLILAVGIQFQDNNTTAGPQNAQTTFGGVNMRLAGFSEVNGGSPAGNSCAAIYYIDEAMYGGSLSGVTADVVVRTSNNQRIHSWTAINAKNVQVAQSEGGAFPAAHGGGSGVSYTITTYHPGLIVTAASACADSASALTATVTGATELQDSGLSTGTRAGQTVTAYSEESAAVAGKTIDVTWSAACTQMAAVSVAFRKKFSGE